MLSKLFKKKKISIKVSKFCSVFHTRTTYILILSFISKQLSKMTLMSDMSLETKKWKYKYRGCHLKRNWS